MRPRYHITVYLDEAEKRMLDEIRKKEKERTKKDVSITRAVVECIRYYAHKEIGIRDFM